ncbi:MAG: ATPase with chaperone, two ATP-bindingdomain [Labilithrix sp.]|nr:ATPase with chaperone, two ATP-bindingdomain [Labilithrix sp.]
MHGDPCGVVRLRYVGPPVPKIDLVTLGLVRDLGSGDSIVALAAEPALASFGDEENALLEAKMFLTEHLAKAEPETVARFALPEGTTLHALDVTIPRADLPRRWNVDTPVRMSCLVIPTVPNTKGQRDRWVMIVPLGHTFFATATEDLDEAITSEVKRIVAAREPTPLEWLDLLPPRHEQLERLEVSFERSSNVEIAKGANLRKRIAEHEARKHAVSVLESVAEPLHAGLARGRRMTPRPFPLRDDELSLLRSMLGSDDRASVLVVGKERVGKTGLFRTWLEREHEVNRPRFVYATSGARLIAGMSGFGQWQERVRRVMEAAHLLDAILYFDDLADLFADRPGGHVDIASAMRPWLEDARVRVVGEMREDVLERVEARNGGFFSCFGRVRLEPFDAARALKVLLEVSTEQATREPERPVLTPEGSAALVELADRYLPYESFPGKAVRLAAELRGAREIALGSEAGGAPIGPDDVHEFFSVRTGVPTFLLRDDRALRVDEVFDVLRKRLVGQDEAVRRVAELVCVVKAGLQPAGKPLATLLFVGPTGVGKTELARALATLLFGSEDRLVRFDMSEYASAYATERLFRGADGGEGLLTRKVREQPFSVILLDEIEKAHPATFDLLLQVCGEGRLTDGRGKTAWFHNAIVILTSNLGASHRRPQAGFGGGKSDDDGHYVKVVRETFRPELVNRIDRIVAFRSLGQDDIREVTRITTERASRRRGVAERGIDLAISDAALAHLAEGGMSEAYGARALRRHVERELVTPIGRLISGRGSIEGDRIAIARETEPTQPGEEPGETHGGLRFGVVPVPSKRSHQAAYALEAVTNIRRRTNRQRRLDRVVQLRDHVGYLVAQLGYGSGRKKRDRSHPRDGAEIALMTGEHSRLAALTDRLEELFAEICAIEELALVGYLSAESDGRRSLEALREEAEELEARFRGTLVQALVAQEPRRDAVTLMVRELDNRRAFDRWLVPLLQDIDRRRWRVELHVDGDRDAKVVSWPQDRRWGPPRSAGWLLDKLADGERSFQNVILRADGDHAGVWLALEAGLHRFAIPGSSGGPAHLHIALVAQRATLTESEWAPPGLDPPTPALAETLSRGPALRDHRDGEPIRLVGGRTTVELGPDEYWPRFEEVALEHLLVFEDDATQDRDAQLRPMLDDTFAEVRELVRRGQKIGAIKLYRDLTGASLLEAKQVVEAME